MADHLAEGTVEQLNCLRPPTFEIPWTFLNHTVINGLRFKPLYWLCQGLWLCGSQETVENSERDGNTRPPDLTLEKPICRSGINNKNWTWNNWFHVDWFQIGKGARQGCIFSPCLFNLYAEFIMRNSGLEEINLLLGFKFAVFNLVHPIAFSSNTVFEMHSVLHLFSICFLSQ